MLGVGSRSIGQGSDAADIMSIACIELWLRGASLHSCVLRLFVSESCNRQKRLRGAGGDRSEGAGVRTPVGWGEGE